jgi:hypothetical protein
VFPAKVAPTNHSLSVIFILAERLRLVKSMSAYTVRVELHSSQYNPDFETLHRSMLNEGFSKFITSDNGKTYYLPRGEYNISTIFNRSHVLEAAKKAVQTTKQSAEILVTESLGRTWDGLTEKK